MIRQFFQRLSYSLRKFMVGRYGTDKLNMVILTAGLAVCLVSPFVRSVKVNLLLTAVSYLPPVGAADNPSSNEVASKYIEDGLQDTGAVNIVTGMILDYRAFDTFGESNVLFIATCTVLILLRSDEKKNKQQAEMEQQREQHYEPKDDCILQKVTFYLFPIIVIYGIYVILNGHLSPGGGFSGGCCNPRGTFFHRYHRSVLWYAEDGQGKRHHPQTAGSGRSGQRICDLF